MFAMLAECKVYPYRSCCSLASAAAISVLSTIWDEDEVQQWVGTCNRRLIAHCISTAPGEWAPSFTLPPPDTEESIVELNSWPTRTHCFGPNHTR